VHRAVRLRDLGRRGRRLAGTAGDRFAISCQTDILNDHHHSTEVEIVMKCLIPILAVFAGVAPALAVAQTEEDAVRAAIEQVFDGMRNKDSAMVRARLADGVVLNRAGERDGAPVLSASAVQGWLNSIAQPRDEILDEQIWDLEIQVDGRLATAWMKYAFFFGGEFSHCGVNTMMLFNDADGWKIFALADTARRDKDECWMPPDGR
jgi:ketosteroid isomerase-like protein